jgi:flagellar biosynthesis/type III secretory pathway protein FliH
MNPNESAGRSAIVKQGAAGRVEPLYTATRLQRRSAVESDRLREEARQELERARAEAEQLVADAKRRAADLVAAAEVECANVKDEAARAARAEVEQRAEALFGSLHRAGEQWTARYPADVAAYAFKLARRIIDCELAAKPEHVLEFVKSALEKARFAGGTIVVYLNPEDVPFVAGAVRNLAEKLRLSEPPRVVEDSTLARASVRVEVGVHRAAWHAGVDAAFADLKKQLERGKP